MINRTSVQSKSKAAMAKSAMKRAAEALKTLTNKRLSPIVSPQNNSELLDEMANSILEKHFNAFDFQNDEREWEEWLNTLAHELRAALLAYQDGARVVVGTHPDLGQVLIKLWDLTIRVLRNTGFSYSMAATITVTVINFTFGSVIEEQSSQLPKTGPKIQRGELPPVLRSALDEWQNENNDMRFDTAVRIIIHGVRAELNTQSSRFN